jgi:ABC-2 type transport system permease protein
MKSPEGFNLVMTFVMWPMFIASGALFPVENLPGWLSPFVMANPMTYGVDLMRLAVLGTSNFGLAMDVGVLALATAIFSAVGIRSFERMQV